MEYEIELKKVLYWYLYKSTILQHLLNQDNFDKECRTGMMSKELIANKWFYQAYIQGKSLKISLILYKDMLHQLW